MFWVKVKSALKVLQSILVTTTFQHDDSELQPHHRRLSLQTGWDDHQIILTVIQTTGCNERKKGNETFFFTNQNVIDISVTNITKLVLYGNLHQGQTGLPKPANLRECHFVGSKVIPDSTKAWIGFHFATHCIADQRARKCCKQMHFASIQCSKMQLWLGIRPEPCWGTYSTPQILQLVLTGEEGKGWKGKEGEERDRKGGEVDSDAQLEQCHWLAKAGPACISR